MLAAELSCDGGAAALLFREGRSSGLTLSIPGTEAIADFRDPGSKRGLRIVRQRAEETEAVRKDENPSSIITEHRMEDCGEEHTAEHAARTARIEGDGGIHRSAEPEGEDRGEEDDAEHHQRNLDRPERVGPLVECEPSCGEKEERHEESGVTEEAE